MFKNALQKWTPAEISRALGCPLRTAYKWRDGERVPPAWLQLILLAVIAREAKMYNKTEKPTTTARKSSEKRRR